MELIYYSHNRYNNTAIIKKHTLQYYELTLVIDGTMRYTVSGDEVYLKPGDAVFLFLKIGLFAKYASIRADEKLWILPLFLTGCNAII